MHNLYALHKEMCTIIPFLFYPSHFNLFLLCEATKTLCRGIQTGYEVLYRNTLCKVNILAPLSYVIKISNDLIEQSQPLHSFTIDFCLTIHTPKIWNGSKHHTGPLTVLRVEALEKEQWCHTDQQLQHRAIS